MPHMGVARMASKKVSGVISRRGLLVGIGSFAALGAFPLGLSMGHARSRRMRTILVHSPGPVIPHEWLPRKIGHRVELPSMTQDLAKYCRRLIFTDASFSEPGRYLAEAFGDSVLRVGLAHDESSSSFVSPKELAHVVEGRLGGHLSARAQDFELLASELNEAGRVDCSVIEPLAEFYVEGVLEALALEKVDAVSIEFGRNKLSWEVGGRSRSFQEFRNLDKPEFADYQALVRIRRWTTKLVRDLVSNLGSMVKNTVVIYCCAEPYSIVLSGKELRSDQSVLAVRSLPKLSMRDLIASVSQAKDLRVVERIGLV